MSWTKISLSAREACRIHEGTDLYEERVEIPENGEVRISRDFLKEGHDIVISTRSTDAPLEKWIPPNPEDEFVGHPLYGVSTRGVWIWVLSELGNAADVAARLKARNCRRVYLKCEDARHLRQPTPRFWSEQCNPETIAAFEAAGIEVWGWGYTYGDATYEEQAANVKRAMEMGLKGYVVDIEGESAGKEANVEAFLKRVRDIVPSGRLAISSFGNPQAHREMPWTLFDRYADIHMPQFYFEAWNWASDEQEVQESFKAFEDLGVTKPIFPIFSSEPGRPRPAPAGQVQAYLDRFPGASCYLLTKPGAPGIADELDYRGSLPVAPEPFSVTPFARALSKGSRGAAVGTLQHALRSNGVFHAGAIGIFGEKTEEAVKLFQRWKELPVTGVVDEATWNKLGIITQTPSEAAEVLPEGDRPHSAGLMQVVVGEANKGLRHSGRPGCEADKYLETFRAAMRSRGHLGRTWTYFEWCASFVGWCLRKSGVNLPDAPSGYFASFALAEAFKYWGQQNGTYFRAGAKAPRKGDIVLFSWDQDATSDHVGFVLSYDRGVLKTIEGNVSDSVLYKDRTRELGNGQVLGFVRLYGDDGFLKPDVFSA